MSNGHVVALRDVLDSPSASAGPITPAVNGTETMTQAEIEIGNAVASAVGAMCQAAMELGNGGLTATTRRVGAERIYRLHEMKRAMPEVDFKILAREQGLARLKKNLVEDGFYQRHPEGAGMPTMRSFVDEVLLALDEVVKFEKAMAN
jgi:hypothetical protein